MIVQASTSGQCGDNVYWEFDGNETVTIRGTGDMYNRDRFTLHSWYSDVYTVNIEEGVTNIGNYFFNRCLELYNVIIANTVTSIGSDAFNDCVILRNISLPSNLTRIEQATFASCENLESIFIPQNVTYIGMEAFAYCQSLNNVFIPKNIITIEKRAFVSCYGLTDVYYEGTEEEWNNLSIGDENDFLTNATIHYNSDGSTVAPSPLPSPSPDISLPTVERTVTADFSGGTGITYDEKYGNYSTNDFLLTSIA